MASSLWNTIDLKKLNIPNKTSLLSQRSVRVKDVFTDVEGIQVFYREGYVEGESSESDISLVLLHGMRFSSKTWLDLGTIQLVTAMGYRTIAIDLPGYGNSAPAEIENKALFLKQLLYKLELKKPVIVSPSMSGFYTLPFLLEYWDTLCGYVPVAPVGYEILQKLSQKTLSSKESICEQLRTFLTDSVPDLDHIQTPTMVVFGEKDCSLSSALLSLLPHSQCQMIPNGGHPAYLDDPDLWHKLLYNFLHNLNDCN